MAKTPPQHNFPYRFETYGIDIYRSSTPMMERVHSHNEIELNCVEKGEIYYQINERRHTFRPGCLYVFSGLAPHRLISCPDGAVFNWLTIPHTHLKHWDLPEPFYNALLQGHVLIDDDPSETVHDLRRFRRWREDFEKKDPRFMRVALLEIRVRLERMSLGVPIPELDRDPRKLRNMRDPSRAVSAMQAFILQHLGETVTLPDIAAAVGLHPKYASSLFRKKTGTTPMGFLNDQRLAYSRLLLASTDHKIIDVALESGFGSQSQFYEAFKRANRISPARFRKEIKSRPLSGSN